MHRRLSLTAVTAVSAITLLTGCGSSSSGSGGSTGGTTGGGTNNSSAAPKTELTDAFHALGAGSALTTSLSLDTTSANLIKITGEDKGTPLTQTQADLISSAKITVAIQAPSGKTLSQAVSATAAGGSGAATSNVQLTGEAGGKTYFTFSAVNQNIYLQLDLKGILDAAGKSDILSGLQAQTASLPAFAKDFLAGKPIEIPASSLKSLTDLLKGASTTSSQVPSSSQITGLITAIETAVLNDVTVARTTTGSTDELAVTGNVRNIAKDILSAVGTALPALSGEIDPAQADQAPDKDVKATASVTGGALSKLEFDFGQFSPHQADSLPIAASFSQVAPNISAPSGATVVTFQDLVSFFTMFAGATTSSSGSSSG